MNVNVTRNETVEGFFNDEKISQTDFLYQKDYSSQEIIYYNETAARKDKPLIKRIYNN